MISCLFIKKYSIKLLKFKQIIVTIVPLINRPNEIYKNDFIGFNSKNVAIITAVQAPVTGNGILTKRAKPT